MQQLPQPVEQEKFAVGAFDGKHLRFGRSHGRRVVDQARTRLGEEGVQVARASAVWSNSSCMQGIIAEPTDFRNGRTFPAILTP